MNPDKLVCIDLDGTLLDDDSSLSTDNIEALNQCLDMNMLVYLVSGRPTYYTEHIANQIDARLKTISFNGAYYENENMIVKQFFNYQDIQTIKKIVDQYDLPVYFKTETKIYTNDKVSMFDYESLGIELKDSLENICDQPILKVILLEKNIDHEVYLDLINTLADQFNVSYYQSKGAEISVKKATKGLAIQQVIETYQIPQENIIVFGDGSNDHSMFDIAHYKIAPKNAIPSIKEKATYISSDNNNSSVAKGLHHYGFLKK